MQTVIEREDFKMKINFNANITCPQCGVVKKEQMPPDT